MGSAARSARPHPRAFGKGRPYHHHYRASGAIRIIMNFRTSSTSTALHPLRHLLQAKPRQASGTLSPQDLRRIVAEMVG